MVFSIDQTFARQIADTVKDVCGRDINFIDQNGIIFASTDETRVGTRHEVGQKAAALGEAIEVKDDTSYPGSHKGINLPIYYNQTMLAVIGISGEPDEVRKYVHLAERITYLLIREQELAARSKSQEDRRHYVVHSLIHRENIGTPYLEHSLEELGVKPDAQARLLLIEVDSRYNPVNLGMMTQEIEQLFESMRIRLYTFYYPNRYMAVADEQTCRNETRRLKRFARNYRGILRIAVGSSSEMYELDQSYLSAQTALAGMKKDEYYVEFDSLTLEILLSGITNRVRGMFCGKILAGLSEEDCSLMRVYFEEDMSLAAACEKLYLHKNTVQYRLNRIADQSGRNPRHFRDAVLFYLALKLRGDAKR